MNSEGQSVGCDTKARGMPSVDRLFIETYTVDLDSRLTDAGVGLSAHFGNRWELCIVGGWWRDRGCAHFR